MKFVCMRRWFVVVAVIALVVVAPSPTLAECPCETQPSGFAGGDGTPGNPFQVCLPEHLDNVRNHVSSHFIQTADIDMSGFGNFTPIGSAGNQFLGRYDGANFDIQNISIIQPGSNEVGLFGVMASTGIPQNIVLTSTNVEGANRTGALLGNNFGSISKCLTDGIVTSSSDQVGGLVGVGSGSITNSRSKGSVTGLFRVGGLVGDMLSGGTINNSYSNSSVSVISGGDGLGGLIGFVASGTTIENSYSSGFVQTSGGFNGGLIGLNQGGTVTASSWDTQTSGQSDSAGGTGKTTAEMQMQSTFDPPWDFTNVWTIDEGNDYPRLLIEQAGPICVLDCQCDDGNDCNGVETCNAGSCVDGIPLECGAFDDECAIGTCNPETGACEQDVATPSGSVCREAANDCDVEEVCDGISPQCPVDACFDVGSPCDFGGAAGECDGECGCLGAGPIPTVSEWGMIALVLLLVTAGSVMVRRRQVGA